MQMRLSLLSASMKLVGGCPALASQPEFRRVMDLRSIDAIAVRLWFDRRLSTRFPANVLNGFEESAGGTFFNLTEMQDEYKDEPGTVIAADFYHANQLLPLSDEEIIAKVHRNITLCEPAFAAAKVVDASVLKFAGAVTHFSPGLYANRPLQTCSIPNAFLAGDWVKGVPHGAKGLSQERAYVTGLRAANLVIGHLGIGQEASILEVEPDEPHMAFGKAAARSVRILATQLGLPQPFL